MYTPWVGDDGVAALAIAIGWMRISAYDSSPDRFDALAELAKHSPYMAVIGYSAYLDRPAVAVITTTTAAIVWLLRPSAAVLRRSMARELARKMDTRVRRDDLHSRQDLRHLVRRLGPPGVRGPRERTPLSDSPSLRSPAPPVGR